jgi:hypothetical protein
MSFINLVLIVVVRLTAHVETVFDAPLVFLELKLDHRVSHRLRMGGVAERRGCPGTRAAFLDRGCPSSAVSLVSGLIAAEIFQLNQS